MKKHSIAVMVASRFLCCLGVLLMWNGRALFAAEPTPTDLEKGDAFFNLTDAQVADLEAKTKQGDFGSCEHLADYLTITKQDPVAAAHWWKVLADQGMIEAMALVGEHLLYARDFDDAEKWLQRGKENGDGYAEDLLQELAKDRAKPAPSHWKAPDPKTLAEFSLTPAPSPDDPKDAAGYLARGATRFRKEDFPGAMADTDRALELDPKNARAYFLRAEVKLNEGSLPEAIADYTRTIELDPKNAEAFSHRAFARCTMGDHDGLLADAEQAIKLDPKNAVAWCSRGEARMAKGDFAGAIADQSQALTLAPKYAAAYDQRGRAQEAQEQWKEAVTDYTHAIEISPKYALYYYDRAGAQMLLRNWPAALVDYRQVGTLGDVDRRQGYAQICLWQIRTGMSEPAEANKNLADYLNGRRNKKPIDWTSWVGNFLLGKTDEATFLTSDQGRQAGLSLTEGWYYAGVKKLLKHDDAGAKELFRKCVDTGKTEFTEYHLAKQALSAPELSTKN
jgi:tetratricopeptide (TPR) repeat protein